MTDSVRLVHRDGIAIRTRADGPADAPAILFLNSLAADLTMWDEVVTGLGHRARAIRCDARGHGGSGAASGKVSLDTLVNDAVAVLDAWGLERALVCGLSLGGLVAQKLAATRPDVVSGLVLANTAASFPPAAMWLDRIETVGAQGLAPLVQPTVERWLTAEYRSAQPRRTAVIADMIAATTPQGYAACAGVLAAADMTSELSAIPCPTLVIVGNVDAPTPPARGEELVRAIGGARLATLAAAHLSSVEQPDAFTGLLLDELAR